MTTAFQRGAFQFGAFQIDSTSDTVLSNHKASGGFSRKRWKELLTAQRALEEAEQQAAELKQSKRKTALEEATQAAASTIEQIEAQNESTALNARLEALTRALNAAAGAKKLAETFAKSRAVIKTAKAALAEIEEEDEEDTITLLLH